MGQLPDGGADNSYTMTLNGVVDAAVNGGIRNYIPFINGEYKDTNPEIYSDVINSPGKKDASKRLASALEEQLSILEDGVAIHGKKCAPSMMPLHEHINLMFKSMKDSTQKLLMKNGRKIGWS